MEQGTSEARPGLLKSVVGLVFYGGMLIAFLGYAYTQFFGNPLQSMMGDNLLEAATRPGTSDRASMDAFKNAGALDKESNWRGYQVRKYDAAYQPDGKLAMVTFALVKSWPGKKLASIDNLQATLTPHCGNAWSRTNDGGVAILQTTDSSSVLKCSALDQGQDSVIVSLASLAAVQPTGQKPADSPQGGATLPAQVPSQQQAPSQAQGVGNQGIKTVAGELIAVAKTNAPVATQIKLNGRLVFDANDAAVKVEKSFTIEGRTVALLSISDGGTACPAVFRFLSIGADGRIITSDEFGTCSDLPKVTAGQSSVMVSMPNMDGKDESSWMFSGDTLSQVRGGTRK